MVWNEHPAAIARIHGGSGNSGLHGTVSFIPRRDGTLVVADICGLPDSAAGFFAFHIHEGGDCRGEDFPDTGGHYNPAQAEHPRHDGDLPPLLSNGGQAFLAVVTGRFRVRNVIGKTVVIHGHPDDFTTQPSGGAGSKIACGVIRRA